MKIFFYGGTFDPPHKGHESIMKYVLPMCDTFIIVPTTLSPNKRELPLASNQHPELLHQPHLVWVPLRKLQYYYLLIQIVI